MVSVKETLDEQTKKKKMKKKNCRSLFDFEFAYRIFATTFHLRDIDSLPFYQYYDML